MTDTLKHHDLLSGLVRLHILHHAAEHPVYGQWMIDELSRHGYRLSPGTVYPMLHRLERTGYLVSEASRDKGTRRRLYTITGFGREGLAVALRQLREFQSEAGTVSPERSPKQ